MNCASAMNVCVHALIWVVAVEFCCAEVLRLNSSNWTQIFEDEWFIEFFAPWCPACQQFSSIWKELSTSPNITAKIAAVDVTESPVLSFAFFVDRLPTVYHVKDCVFRQYDGERTINELKNYLTNELFNKAEPVKWYYSPASVHMRIFIKFMDLGVFITNLHQGIVNAGYNSWISITIIGFATIFSGLFIGLTLVLIFDCFFPPRPQIFRLFRKKEKVEPLKKVSDDTSDREHHTDASDASGSENIPNEYDDEMNNEIQSAELRQRVHDKRSDS